VIDMDEVESKIQEILDSVKANPTYIAHWSAFKKIEGFSQTTTSDEKRLVRIAVIGSSTLDPLAACISIKTRLSDLFPETWIGGFNTYRQEAFEKDSGLYKFNPDIVVLSVDGWSLLPNSFLSDFVDMSSMDREEHVKYITHEVVSVAKKLERDTNALVLVNNFVVPTFSPFGIVDEKQDLGLKDFFRAANKLLQEPFMETNRVHFVDVDSCASDFGKTRMRNWRTYYRGSVPFGEDFTLHLAEEYLRYIRAFKGLSKKCIVVDLDNTLWGGIIGEDGINNIKLGATSPGIEYVEFQRVLLSLYNRGIILAVNSKNNLDDAMQVLREHPYQVLKEDHFAAFRINWNSKVQNLKELAEEINIGLDSMVFLDDNPREREQVRYALPQVLVVEMPENPQLYRETIEGLRVFDVLSLTKEDMERGKMYVGKRKRIELQLSTESSEDYLRTLDLVVTIREATDFDLPRVVQLIGKTNQFNLTTRRYSEAEVNSLRDSDDSAVYCMSVKDKFGDEGIVAVAIVRKHESKWVIDSFLMSCRVIGRTVETAFLAKIISDAKRAGVKSVEGEFIPSKKNAPAKDLYSKHDFTHSVQTGDDENITSWMFMVDEQELRVPEWIDLVEE
jgi:FkbH-like protein